MRRGDGTCYPALMGILDQAKSGTDRAGASLRRLLGGFVAAVTLPVALVFALTAQFAVGWLIMTLSPPPDLEAPSDIDGALWAQVLTLLAQGAALVLAVSRSGIRPSRVYLALMALVWAAASMLLMFVALQCDLAGVCL